MWNPVVCITARTGELSSELPGTVGAIGILDIINSFDHKKSSSILQVTKGKSRNLQKLLNFF